MKISKKLLISSLAYLLGFTSVFAAGTIDHFEVVLPNEAKVGEAVDLTIKAVDRNDIVVKDYTNDIMIFTYSEAEFPLILKENVYSFLSSDQGVVVFENAIKFFEEGLQSISVMDIDDDDIIGIGEIKIIKSGNSTSSSTESIDIVSPENGLTIGGDSVKVSGTTAKNHQVKIFVNGKEQGLALTNDNGIYGKELKNLEEGENIIVAKVLDADENVIGTSSEVKIKVEKGVISLISSKAVPGEVNSGEAFELQIIATPELKEVSVIMGDITAKLKETETGKYVAKLYAPVDAGTYPIDVILKDELGHEKKELGVSSIIVNFVEPEPEPEIEVLPEPEISECESEGGCSAPKNDPLKVKGLKLVELKSKSVLTWDKVPDAKSYNVYKKLENGSLEFVENVKNPVFEILIDMTQKEEKYEYFAVRALGETNEGDVYEGDLSEATKIQTGPEILILLIISIFIGGLFMMIKQKRA